MTSTTPRKRRAYAARVPAEQRRTQVLDAALHLVVTRGHNATTMDAVAEQAGVTKPVVYGQFRSRNELLAALLRREQEAALRQLLAVLPGDPGRLLTEDAPDFLARMLADFLNAVQETPDRWYCVVMPMADMPAEFHTAREAARAIALDRAESLTRWLLEAIDAPAELDPEIVAHTVTTLFEMAARLVLTDPGRYRPERFVAAIQAALGLVSGKER
ncbi:TetR/AcrR family transcriptional regulator [Amycolatopsis decaplanina]|uniref:TetR family transcriptional regulator n=1 Tax=Amycolatopsis decaplanina DSM 44594 TaxID=1284240 RepID=M2YMI9_9PSEU|nr:TetR/AcrR family transcriptional regulator [Amycolatopsis decaplanina]EME55922.1 TetR family transcriptional regulator [Amycolatopsis decaplanina DSM 44594]